MKKSDSLHEPSLVSFHAIDPGLVDESFLLPRRSRLGLLHDLESWAKLLRKNLGRLTKATSQGKIPSARKAQTALLG